MKHGVVSTKIQVSCIILVCWKLRLYTVVCLISAWQ